MHHFSIIPSFEQLTYGSEVSITLYVHQFNIRTEENMSGPPADTKNAAPGKRGPLPSKSSPASTRRSPLKRSPSSQSRKAKQSLGRAESLSPTRSAASGMKAPRAQSGKSNGKHKEPFTTGKQNVEYYPYIV